MSSFDLCLIFSILFTMSTMDDLFARVNAQDSPDVVENILTATKIDVNCCWKSDNSLLVVAARRGHFQTVKLLLRLGADVNASNKDGKTALMEAARKCQVHVVEALLSSGADRDATDKDDWDAQDFALCNNKPGCWELFSTKRIKMLREAEVEKAWNEDIRQHSWAAPEAPEPETETSTTEARAPAVETCPIQVCECAQDASARDSTAPPETTAATEHTWLYPHLLKAGFAPEVIQDCEQKLVHRHAVHSPKIFALMSAHDMNREYFDAMGIRQVGVQRVLFDMHGWAKAQEVVLILAVIFAVIFGFIGLCVVRDNASRKD